MSFVDFCLCTPDELEEIIRAWREGRDSEHRDRWERMRLLATMVMQPHYKKKLHPDKLLRFPWEKRQETPKSSVPVPDKAEAKRNLENRLRHP